MSILEIGYEYPIQVPDENGVHKTRLGDIGVEIIQWGQGDLPKVIKIESDLLRGTPKKNWWRRKRIRTVYLGWGGSGEQRISKKEILKVRPDPEKIWWR